MNFKTFFEKETGLDGWGIVGETLQTTFLRLFDVMAKYIDYKTESDDMGFKKYEKFVDTMPDFDDAALGLAGEVGEVLEHVKKDRRPDGRRQPLNKEAFTAELGDVLFYLTRLAHKNGITLKEVADYNEVKLTKRHG